MDITGSWDDDWGSSHYIDPFSWWSSGVWGEAELAVTTHDNTSQYYVADNGDGTWSRIDWAWDADDQLFVCQGTYDAATEADAIAAETTDADDLSIGCGGFAWTQLRSPNPISGDWADNWGTLHSIDSFTWAQSGEGWTATYEIGTVNDEDSYLTALNGEDTYYPGSWSRFDWTYSADGDRYYCQIASDMTTELEASGAIDADADDLEAGCGGFGWSQLMEPLDIRGLWILEETSSVILELSETEVNLLEGASEPPHISYDVLSYDNAAATMILQLNDEDTAEATSFELGSFFNVAWQSGDDGSIWLCEVSIAVETLAEATSATVSSWDTAEACSSTSEGDDLFWFGASPID
jgi:hypothetical protein